MRLAWDMEKEVRRIRVHKYVAAAIVDALEQVLRRKGRFWLEDNPGSMQNLYGGAYEYRMMKGSARKLSVHAFGAAIDINPHLSPYRLRGYDGNWVNRQDDVYVEAFLERGFVTYPYDGMHFQACK